MRSPSAPVLDHSMRGRGNRGSHRTALADPRRGGRGCAEHDLAQRGFDPLPLATADAAPLHAASGRDGASRAENAPAWEACGSCRATARQFSEALPQHITLLLKGARTVIASSNHPLCFNTTGHPGMASGGMGDTLTGLCAALIGPESWRPMMRACPRLAQWPRRGTRAVRDDGARPKNLLAAFGCAGTSGRGVCRDCATVFLAEGAGQCLTKADHFHVGCADLSGVHVPLRPWQTRPKLLSS